MQGRVIAVILAALVALVAIAPAASGAAKKGKVHVCVEKRGKDKGVMHLSKTKRCHKGLKSITFNKRGPAGKAGERGPEGPAGEGASPDAIAALQQALASQAAQISALQSQLETACGQLSVLTGQANALGTALNGIGLGGTIPALLTLVNPGAPPGLPAFGC